MRWKKTVGKRNVSVCKKPGIFKRKVCKEKLSCLDFRQNNSQYLTRSAYNM